MATQVAPPREDLRSASAPLDAKTTWIHPPHLSYSNQEPMQTVSTNSTQHSPSKSELSAVEPDDEVDDGDIREGWAISLMLLGGGLGAHFLLRLMQTLEAEQLNPNAIGYISIFVFAGAWAFLKGARMMAEIRRRQRNS